jgi:hypothetical protein
MNEFTIARYNLRLNLLCLLKLINLYSVCSISTLKIPDICPPPPPPLVTYCKNRTQLNTRKND